MINLVCTLIVSGIIAGLVNFFYTYLSLPINPIDETTEKLTAEEQKWQIPPLTWYLALLGYLIMGIAGALLTPLINEIVSLKGLEEDLYKIDNLLILCGYGIVFGFSLNRMLPMITNSILRKLQISRPSVTSATEFKLAGELNEKKFEFRESSLCPNVGEWSKAPNYNSSPLKSMSWANNLPKDKFGCSRNSGNKFHAGIDLEAEVGTECFALANGTITDIGFGTELGKFIALQFEEGGNKYGAGYCHLDEIIIKKGDKVTSGQLIGKTGKTGNVGTDKPHLHLEIHKNKWLTYSSEDDRSKASLDPNHYV